MKSSPKLRPGLWDAVLVLLVVLLATGSGAVVWNQRDQAEELIVVITVDGNEVERCALEELPAGERAYSHNGYTLQVVLDQPLDSDVSGVRVSVSDCPTQDCVHTGTIARAGQSIVCLPARIIVRLEGSTAEHTGPDIVIG